MNIALSRPRVGSIEYDHLHRPGRCQFARGHRKSPHLGLIYFVASAVERGLEVRGALPCPGVPLARRWGLGRVGLSAPATWRPGPVGAAATPGPTARGRCDLKSPAPSGLGRRRGRGAKVGAFTPRASPEGPQRHGRGVQAPEQGGQQPPAPRAPGAGGRGGRRDFGAPGAGRRGGRERSERGAPGGPERAAGAPGPPPRALRAAGGARAGRQAQEEVPAEAEEVRQERGEGHRQRVPLPGPRPAGLRRGLRRPVRSGRQRGVLCPLEQAALARTLPEQWEPQNTWKKKMSCSVESDDCSEWDISTRLLSVFTFPGHRSLQRAIRPRMRLAFPLGPRSRLLTLKPLCAARVGRQTLTRWAAEW